MSKKSTIRDARFEAMIRILKDARIELGLTQEQLSEKLGQHRIFVNKVELGERRLDVVELYDLCVALNLSIHTLIKGTLEKTETEILENPDYILRYANGYLNAFGYLTDRDISKKLFEESTDAQ